ncbi:beta-galactosidase [Capsulimonas corticalis]|uniref:Beta-galactosidase n=1 Tax=Capsulimonas corticalis TaxID=2219043 RepID=A0A402CTG9_9BACT|nr:DUF5597 domain-containing protein [Capsulimonas corticalis]BDI30717.1 beta-galactosidase [Capsulimonas corticalis]
MKPLPYLQRADGGAQLIVDGAPFLMLGGEVHNSSSSSLAYMERVWERMTSLHCNTALTPVSWELIEPVEGEFDFRLVDGLLEGARRHGMRLVPLWFGAFKNGRSTYAPEWVKTNPARFIHAQSRPGHDVLPLSSFCEETVQADARAFAALMRHLREVDSERRTVVMMQVENEVGLMRAQRDYSAPAERVFSQPVPSSLIGSLQENAGALHPGLAHARLNSGPNAMWADIFGSDASEAFMSWGFGRFVGRVAEAGRAEYPLPHFANAWLVQYEGQPPGEYPNGGPVSRMMDIWRAAAPAIELLAPDIYIDDFACVCADYARNGNPLFIPEARRDHTAPACAFYAIGEHSALGFSPFGIESIGGALEEVIAGPVADASLGIQTDPSGSLLAQSYRLLSGMAPVLAPHFNTNTMRGILQTPAPEAGLDLGGFRLQIRFPKALAPGQPPAGGLIITLGPGDYLIAGFGFSVQFHADPHTPGEVDFLDITEGDYADGQWIPGRRLNGDEYAVQLGAAPCVRRARVYQHHPQ